MRIYIDALVSGDVDHSGKRVQNGLAWELAGVYFILLNSPIACLLAVAVYKLMYMCWRIVGRVNKGVYGAE